MSELVKQTRNIFIDSETNTIQDQVQVSVNLIPNDFYCTQDEEMRITLTTFEMRTNWYNINQYNNVFYVFTPTTAGSASGTYYQVQIAAGTYYDFLDRVYNPNVASPTTIDGLATAIQTALNGAGIGTGNTCTYSPITRKFSIGLNVSASGNNGTITANSYIVCLAIPQGLATYIPTGVSPLYTFMDTNEIIGGIPMRTYSSASVVPVNAMGSAGSVSAGILTLVSPYVAQLNSQEALYFRTNLQTLNYSTYGFAQTIFQNTITGSQIMARIPLPSQTLDVPDPFISYEDTNNNFQIIVGNKQLDNITIYITDDKNRPIPNVAVGQVVNGMMSFKCSLKWEVILKDSANPFIPTIQNVKDRLIAFPRQP
jgi:hypothetical protein